MKLKLVRLSIEYKSQFMEMMDEWMNFKDYNRSPVAIRRNDYHDFDYYLEHLEHKESTPDIVPDTVWFCLDEELDKFVGAADIRHYFGPAQCGLQHNGGHIGDGIRPSFRGKGYGTEMLRLALEKCDEMGMNKVLICCLPENIGSARCIQKNGGVYEMDAADPETGEVEQRYWITLHDEKVETERLVLRRELPGDYKDVWAWASDPEVYTFLLSEPVKKPEDLIGWLESAEPNDKNKYMMIARSKTDGHAVGTVGVFKIGENLWDVAYNVLRSDWGKGFATEAVSAMIEYVAGLNPGAVFEIEAAVENTASGRIAEKLGFKFYADSSYTKHDGSKTFISKKYRL